MFEHHLPQTDWTQDPEELLLSGGPTSVFHLRSLTLSDAELAPSYDYQISASPCDQPMVKIDEDFDFGESLLRLTGHEVPPVFSLSYTHTTIIYPGSAPNSLLQYL